MIRLEKTKENMSRQEARAKVKADYPGIGKDVVHHRDGNPLNNDTTNLCVLSRKQHYQYHMIEGGPRISNTPRQRIDFDTLAAHVAVYNMECT